MMRRRLKVSAIYKFSQDRSSNPSQDHQVLQEPGAAQEGGEERCEEAGHFQNVASFGE